MPGADRNREQEEELKADQQAAQDDLAVGSRESGEEAPIPEEGAPAPPDAKIEGINDRGALQEHNLDATQSGDRGTNPPNLNTPLDAQGRVPQERLMQEQEQLDKDNSAALETSREQSAAQREASQQEDPGENMLRRKNVESAANIDAENAARIERVLSDDTRIVRTVEQERAEQAAQQGEPFQKKDVEAPDKDRTSKEE